VEDFCRASGARAAPVRVKQFSVADDDIGIEPLPSSFRSFLSEPDAEAPEDQRQYRKLIDDWLARGDYVLVWGNEYDVNKDGEIVFS
jgi:hypothetical protein